MGKEAELLEAARAGNLPAVDRLLASRAKLSGPLASLRRGPGANVQDSSGYTPLHHASLNGHYDIVQLLLKYDASPKILDTKGSSPLHLAAWAGHTGIVRLLLSANPAFTNINHTTRDNESALHCAAQYGHTAVVSMLLQHGADPTIRNSRDETALDLASQYGRLETVELLVRTHPELLDPYRNSQGILPHTPLHRASKNGHKAVVVVLLKAGHNVNACTGAGAALHEAALCGKVNVVRALLTRGADPRVRDRAGHTVLDALAEFPTHVTHEIVALINQYRLSNGFDSETEDLPRIPVHQPDGLNSPYDNVQSNSGNNRHIWERRDGEDERRVSGTSAISIGSDGCHYPYSKSSIMDGSYHSEELSSSYQSGKVREPDQLSISSTTSSTGGPSPRERQRCGTNESSISGQGMYISMGTSGYHAHSPGSNTKVSPTPPKKPPRRNLSVSPTHLLPPGGVPDVGAPNERSHHLVRTGQTRSQDDLDDLGPGAKHSGLRHGRSVDQYVDSKASPRTKPIPQPRPSLALLASRRDQPVAINAMYENIVIKEQNPRRKLRRNNPGQYENINPKEKNSAREEETHSRSKNQKYHSSQERSSLESLLDDVSSYQGGTPSDGESMGYRNDRSSQHTPLSPTHYNQPPTPDHPPPSARQAEMSIHERIRPLSQEYKRMSRDMETETDPRLLARSSSPASSASTDHCVEEYVAEVPFAGLFKGSTTTLDGIGVRPVPAERPKSLRKLKTVYDNGGQGVIGPGGGVIRPKEIQPGTRIDPDVDPWQYRHTEDKEQTSNPSSIASLDKPLSMLSPFDEQEEWAKINEIMASFGSRIVRESVFAEELEQEFQSRLGVRTTYSESSISPSAPAGPSILSWLTSLNLQHLESNFVNNGYDHIDFINGVIEDNDLAEMAIEEPEKTKVLESCKSLPTKIDEVMSAAVGNNHNNNNNNNNNINNNNNSDKESEADPEAVNKWLTSIGLECYQDTFRRHLYTDMERVRRIWEVELTAVLEIQKVGHRRRILASVAGRQNGPINNIDDIADLNTLDRDIQTLKAEIKEKLPETSLNNHVAHPEQQAIIPHAKSAPPPLAVPVSQNLAAPTSGGETLKRSHKKNRPPPPPPARGADLEIRAPFALMVGVPGTMCTQWKHQPVVLVTGSVMYVANYLGSTIVKELRGKESTQKSIQKLKKSTNEPRILPDIILSISYRGVKFLNTITRELVCEHEIRNIHLACQDADDLTHFAYITKDITTKSHYCHVFSVATMDQATEVILTLGQAFEVAYQMALRDSATKSNTNTLQAPSGQVRSQSSNQISQQAKTPTHEKSNSNTKDRPNPVHGRSHSVTEIKLNGHQLKVAPITVSISNEDFQAASRNGDVQKSPRTPSAKAPIAVAEEL